MGRENHPVRLTVVVILGTTTEADYVGMPPSVTFAPR